MTQKYFSLAQSALKKYSFFISPNERVQMVA